MDDPTWCCDYHSRCDNKIIKEILNDLTTKYDNNPKWTLKKIINKWTKRYKKNEEDDK